MASTFPTKHELRCSGISFIISHLLIFAAWGLGSLPLDVYDVQNDIDVIALHNALSSPSYRIRAELQVTCLWIAFPLLLIALFGLKKNAFIWFKSTSGEMYVYLFEKAYIIWITVAMIILPALSLVIVSYDWSFDEADPSQSTSSVPTGYYIQLFIIIFQFEAVDCMAVADAVFMISLCILALIVNYATYTNKENSQTFKDYMNIMKISNYQIIVKSLVCCCTISTIIIFLIILFQFAESGFFSITGYSKVLLVWIFICKMLIGVDLIRASTNNKYIALKKIYEKTQQTENIMENDQL